MIALKNTILKSLSCLMITSIITLCLYEMSWSASIIQDQSDGAGIFSYNYGPRGQSFTAEDQYIYSIGFFIEEHDQGDFLPITMDLYEGIGYGGSLLKSADFTPGAGYNDFYDVDFSDVSFTVGNMYSVKLTTTSNKWALHRVQHSYPNGSPRGDWINYEGGDMLDKTGTPVPYMDLTFRVLAPEPISSTLFLTGAATLGFRMYRKKRTA